MMEPPTKRLVRNTDVDAIHTDWGSLRWLIRGSNGSSEEMTLGRVTINPGMANPLHQHPNCEEILYVESGRIEHTLPDGEGVVEMMTGDVIVIPQGKWHSARNIGSDEAVVIVAFNSAWRETIGEE